MTKVELFREQIKKQMNCTPRSGSCYKCMKKHDPRPHGYPKSVRAQKFTHQRFPENTYMDDKFRCWGCRSNALTCVANWVDFLVKLRILKEIQEDKEINLTLRRPLIMIPQSMVMTIPIEETSDGG